MAEKSELTCPQPHSQSVSLQKAPSAHLSALNNYEVHQLPIPPNCVRSSNTSDICSGTFLGLESPS